MGSEEPGGHYANYVSHRNAFEISLFFQAEWMAEAQAEADAEAEPEVKFSNLGFLCKPRNRKQHNIIWDNWPVPQNL